MSPVLLHHIETTISLGLITACGVILLALLARLAQNEERRCSQTGEHAVESCRDSGTRCTGRLENRQCRHLERNRPNAGDSVRYACRGVNTQLYSAGLVIKGGFDVVD
jgi:hypothetical protein